MDQLHFGSYCAAIVALFIWNQWQRQSGRAWRVLGAVVIVAGLAFVLPWAIQHIGPS
jgi:hypothetical protein